MTPEIPEGWTAHDGSVPIRPWRVAVDGHNEFTWYARSRSKALALAWEASLVAYSWTFGEFLKHARAWATVGHPQWGKKIVVCNLPAFMISSDSQYIQFVRPGSEDIFNAHPLDVEPPEARQFTAYRTEQ